MSTRGAAALAALVAGLASAPPLVAGAPASPAPARVLVTASEFHFALSRTTVRPGPAILQLANRGQDGHDLVVRRAGSRGRQAAALAETASGELGTLRVTLRPGHYVLLCSLPGHRAAGMQARLTVGGR